MLFATDTSNILQKRAKQICKNKQWVRVTTTITAVDFVFSTFDTEDFFTLFLMEQQQLYVLL